jgi:hypothetical protein
MMMIRIVMIDIALLLPCGARVVRAPTPSGVPPIRSQRKLADRVTSPPPEK